MKKNFLAYIKMSNAIEKIIELQLIENKINRIKIIRIEKIRKITRKRQKELETERINKKSNQKKWEQNQKGQK